jgi:hypothetical protein
MSDDEPTLTAAEERFATRLSDDLGRILGTGILIEELDLGGTGDGDDVRGGPARIKVLCLFDGGAETIEAEGETADEAYGRIIGAAAEMRLAIASRRMIAPT